MKHKCGHNVCRFSSSLLSSRSSGILQGTLRGRRALSLNQIKIFENISNNFCIVSQICTDTVRFRTIPIIIVDCISKKINEIYTIFPSQLFVFSPYYRFIRLVFTTFHYQFVSVRINHGQPLVATSCIRMCIDVYTLRYFVQLCLFFKFFQYINTDKHINQYPPIRANTTYFVIHCCSLLLSNFQMFFKYGSIWIKFQIFCS